jgi:hypothetical protein
MRVRSQPIFTTERAGTGGKVASGNRRGARNPSTRLRGDLEGMIVNELIHIEFVENIERVMHCE